MRYEYYLFGTLVYVLIALGSVSNPTPKQGNQQTISHPVSNAEETKPNKFLENIDRSVSRGDFSIKNLLINEKVERAEFNKKKCSYFYALEDDGIVCLYKGTTFDQPAIYGEVIYNTPHGLKRSVVFVVIGTNNDEERDDKARQEYIAKNKDLYQYIKNSIDKKTKSKSVKVTDFDGPLYVWYKQSGLMDSQAKVNCKGAPQISLYIDQCRNQLMGGFYAITTAICGTCKYRVRRNDWRSKGIAVELKERFTDPYINVTSHLFKQKVSSFMNNHIAILYYNADDKNAKNVPNQIIPDIEEIVTENSSTSSLKKPDEKDF